MELKEVRLMTKPNKTKAPSDSDDKMAASRGRGEGGGGLARRADMSWQQVLQMGRQALEQYKADSWLL